MDVMTFRLVLAALLVSGYASMSVPANVDGDAMIRALGASGPHPTLGEGAATFAWLTGSWDLECDIIARDGKRTHSSGDWEFGWIMDGRMMQDTIYFYPAGKPEERAGGTSVRMYDPHRKLWTVAFFSPQNPFFVVLKGGKFENRIVLKGKDPDGIPIRWSFSDIRPDSFHWVGERTEDGGKTWWMEQEMFLTRHH